MKTIKLYLDTEGNLTCSQDLSNLTQYTFQENLLSVCVPKEIIESPIKEHVVVSVVFSSQDTTGGLETESYNMQYVKDIVSDSAEYYLYSRLSPKRMTLYSGTQQLAINISYLENGACVSRTTSQRLSYNVIASDYDLETEEVSDSDNLQSQIETINQKLDNDYQTKIDTNIKVASDNDSTYYDVPYDSEKGKGYVNAVVSALTKLDERVKEHQKYLFNSTYDSEKETIENRVETNEKRIETNEKDITDNKSSIDKHETRITTLESKISEFFHFLGSVEYTYKGEPKDEDLEKVLTDKGHTEKHIGDCLLAISTYGEQDTLYICIWNGSAWSKLNVVCIQKADNDNYGVIKSSVNVRISSGQVSGIYVNTGRALYPYVNIDEWVQKAGKSLSTLSTNIETETARAKNVENSLTEKDTDLQNQINETKSDLTETKNDIKTNYPTTSDMIEYALPRSFNDVYYIDFTNSLISENMVVSSKLNSYGVGQTEVGTFTLVNDKYYYQLSRKNNITLRLYYYNSTDLSGALRITLNVYHNAINNEDVEKTQLCSYTQDLVIYNDNSIHPLDIDTTLNALGSEVVDISKNDYFTYELFITNETNNTYLLLFMSNATYTSTMQYTCVQTPIANLNYTEVIDEILVFEKHGSVEGKILYL